MNKWKKEYSNWGRWGKDDERGALNLITPAKQRQAARLVKDGVSVSLARLSDYELNAETNQGVPGTGPYVQHMASAGIDWFELKYHGYAHTHLDALAHVNDNGAAYNGITQDKQKVMTEGLSKGSIMTARKGVMTRGILIDVPRLRDVPYLEVGERVGPADIEAFEKMARIKVSPGDALLVRTGRWVRRNKVGPWPAFRNQVAGLDASIIPWLRQRDVAILGGECPQDAAPSGADSGP